MKKINLSNRNLRIAKKRKLKSSKNKHKGLRINEPVKSKPVYDFEKNELKLARKIQEDYLPVIGDEFNSHSLSIYADLKPAKEVSGDFYDIFHVNQNIICFIVADVSGKGFPAAFFMAIAKTTIKNICLSGFNVNLDFMLCFNRASDLLYLINNALEINNISSMFVTAFIGLYNKDTGKLYYSNAGHLPPLKLNHNTGEIQELGCGNNPVLGIFKNIEFEQSEISVDKNETVIIYTDGITEATNSELKEYGTERLLNLLRDNRDRNNIELTKKIFKDIEEFQNYKLFDDATVFTLSRK